MKKFPIFVRCFVAIVSFYLFYHPEKFVGQGYALGVDGTVVGKALFLLYGIFNLVHVIEVLENETPEE